MLSRPENITPIVEAIQRCDPASILDVGVGMGKYGVIAREALYAVYAEAGELERCDQLIVDGVDLAGGHRAPWLAWLYDELRLQTDVAELPIDSHWDLALIIDLLEHWTPDQAAARIGRLRAQAKRIIVSTPSAVTFFDTDPYGDNVPGHVTQWTLEQLRELLGPIDVLATSPSFIVMTETPRG